MPMTMIFCITSNMYAGLTQEKKRQRRQLNQSTEIPEWTGLIEWTSSFLRRYNVSQQK